MITGNYFVALAMTFFMLAAGFLFSAVGAYMAGIVGSSNNPISGVTLATIIVASLGLLPYFGADPKGPPAAIMIGAIVCCAAALSGDNIQDLKSGHLLGATPLILQMMQVIGVIAPSLVFAPVIGMLISAYGIGDPTESHPNALPAPQAAMMTAVTQAIFSGKVPYLMVGIGAALALAILLLDWTCYWRLQYRIPVLSATLGLYLPLGLSVPIFLGGLIAYVSNRTLQYLHANNRQTKTNENNGLLFAAGLITGEAVTGIIVALVLVITRRSDAMAFAGNHSHLSWPGVLVLAAVCITLYFITVPRGFNKKRLKDLRKSISFGAQN
jgi:putative OPT family oligopeptide transporter